MAQWLKVFVLAEDLDSSFNSYIVARNNFYLQLQGI